MLTFNPQAVANTAWAFAMLEIQNEPLIGALADWTLQKVVSFA